MFASPAVYTRRCALAAQLRKLHLGIGQIFSRDMTVQCDAQHPCWKAAHFLPCTRPPDVMRLHRSSNRATYGPSERRAYALTRSGFQTMPRRDEDAVTEVAASATARGARAPRFGTRAHATTTPPRAHRVAPAAALVALRVAPIPIGLTRIRRPLSNASSTGVIVACRRTPVSMPLCLSAKT